MTTVDTSREALTRLMVLVEPYIHPAASRVRIDITPNGLVGYARLQLKPSGRTAVSSAAARLALFQRGQEVISAVERDGWRHADHPEITVTGQMTGGRGDQLLAEGWLTLRLAVPQS